jgi:protein-S-isoprenylcysteine O-methyltransferase Ste14
MPFWKHLRAILLLPVMVTIVIPYLLSLIPQTGEFGVEEPSIEMQLLTHFGGFVAVYLGGLLLLSTIWLFVRHGRGTLAPWDPTGKLVVRGIYKRVRNPMITGVALILVGETLFSGSFYHLAWTLLFVVANAIYIPLSEEPGLEKRFGEDYLEYKRNVPRWRPRLRPWEPEETA